MGGRGHMDAKPSLLLVMSTYKKDSSLLGLAMQTRAGVVMKHGFWILGCEGLFRTSLPLPLTVLRG